MENKYEEKIIMIPKAIDGAVRRLDALETEIVQALKEMGIKPGFVPEIKKEV